MTTHPKLTVFGTGALGCVFAAKLAPVTDVTVVGTWQAAIDAFNSNGVRLTDRHGNISVTPVRATRNPADARADIAIVLTKSWQTARVARQAAQLLADDGLVVTLQNGLGNDDTLAAAVGRARVAVGITLEGGIVQGPGQVLHVGGDHTDLARGDHPYIERLAALLNEAGLDTALTDHVDALVWQKLVINSAVNPLTALLNVPNGGLVASDHADTLMVDTVRETAAVAAAIGITLDVGALIPMVRELMRHSARNHTSMLQDLKRGAPTEIEAINGAVAKAGQQAGVATPLNNILAALIRARVALAEHQVS